jgi:hypothetical protein
MKVSVRADSDKKEAAKRREACSRKIKCPSNQYSCLKRLL